MALRYCTECGEQWDDGNGYRPHTPWQCRENVIDRLRRQLAAANERLAKIEAARDAAIRVQVAAREALFERVRELEKALGVRQEVAAFAAAMEAKLKENDHKGGWDSCTMSYLRVRVSQEVAELSEAMMRRDYGAAALEAADVGNYAMMIFDRAHKALGGSHA